MERFMDQTKVASTLFKRKISKEQSRDTGMAVVLLLLLLNIIFKIESLLALAIIAQVVNMVIPNVYRSFARLWLGLSELLGTVVSKILLTIVFLFVVTPMGLIRKWSGKDSLNLKAFRRDDKSIMKNRDHTFTRDDLEKPY